MFYLSGVLLHGIENIYMEMKDQKLLSGIVTSVITVLERSLFPLLLH